MAHEQNNRVKFQGMVSADTKRFLEIEWRKGKNPTLLTWNDLVDFCVEMGHRALVAENDSQQGKYVVEMIDKKRRKDAEEALKRIEYEVEGWVPREERQGTVHPLRRIEGDGG